MAYFLSFAPSPPDSVRPTGVSEEFRPDTSRVSDSPSDDPAIFCVDMPVVDHALTHVMRQFNRVLAIYRDLSLRIPGRLRGAFNTTALMRVPMYLHRITG